MQFKLRKTRLQNKLTKNISYAFAMTSAGSRRGSQKRKGKNSPLGMGNMTFSTSLAFLFKQKELMHRNKHKTMLLGALNCDKGLDPVKKRFNFYGIFGLRSQSNPERNFEYGDITTIFLSGVRIPKYELNKLDIAMAAIERKLGDEHASAKTVLKSPKLKEAYQEAGHRYMLVVASYDESFFTPLEDDETKAYLSMSYVTFGTGKVPMISPFDHQGKDSIVETDWYGKKEKDYVLDPDGTFSIAVTRQYLKDYGGHGRDNLVSLSKKDGTGKFWLANLYSCKVKDLPASVAVHFSKDCQAVLKSCDYVTFQNIFTESAEKTIDQILNVKEKGNAVLVFCGCVKGEDEEDIRVNEYTNKNGKTVRDAQITLSRGTFYTQKTL